MGISKSYLKELAKKKKFGQLGYKELPNDQTVRVPVPGALQNTREFYTSFMNSPRYQQMLEGKTFNPYGTFRGETSDFLKLARLRNLQRTEDNAYTFQNAKDWKTYTGNNNSVLGFNKSGTGEIYLHPNFYTSSDSEPLTNDELKRETISHEFSHSIDRPLPYSTARVIPDEDIYEIQDRTFSNQREFLKTKGNTLKTWEYLTEPTEVRARINSVREKLWKNGIDVGNKQITAEDIKNIDTENLKDLREILKEEDIIWMLNNISKTETPQKQKYAKAGAYVSTKGYKRNSPDVNNPYNVIPSNQITMKGVDFPIMGIDNTGHQKMMYPGQDYTFPGNYVTEFPLKNMGNKRFGQAGLEKNSEAFLKNWIEKRQISDPYIQEAYLMDKPEFLKRTQSFPPIETVPIIEDNPNISGRYERATGKILRTPDAPPHITTHEQTHYLQDFPSYMRTVHKNIVGNELKPAKELEGLYKEKYPYFSDPDEVHSRIMVLREKAGFRPDKPVTEKDLNKFLEGYKGDIDNINDILELSKDKKSLLNMLNYMARNEQPTEYYGQKGFYKPDFRSKSQIAASQGNTGESTKVGSKINPVDMQKAQEAARQRAIANQPTFRQGRTLSANEQVENQSRLAKIREQQEEEENRRRFTFTGNAEARGASSPLNDVLDFVNPFSYYYAGKDAVRGLGQAAEGINNLDFKGRGLEQIGSGLTQAGLGVLGAIPVAAELKPALKGAGKYLTQGPLKNVFKQLPGSSNVDDVGNIFKGSLTDKEKKMYQWFEENQRLDALPLTKNKKTLDVLEDFKHRIQTPEGQKRMKELGIDNDFMLRKIEIVEDPNTFGYFSGNRNRVVLNPEHPLPRKVARHEIEHGVQNAKLVQDVNKAGGTEFIKDSKLMQANTEIDDLLSGLELRKQGTPNKEWDYSKVVDGSPVDISEYKSLISNKQNATDYFLTGSQGREKSAFLGEVQQYMMDNNIIPKTSYVEVTPEMVKNTFVDAMFDETGGGKYLRLFNIMKPTEANYKLISKGLNKMLGLVPYVGTGYLGYEGLQGAGALQQNQKPKGTYQGGGTKDSDYMNFIRTLPSNLAQPNDPSYNLKGYWDALGKPSSFDYTQPVESDGYYHAFSRDPRTGQILKAPFHPTFKMAIEEDRKAGYFPIVTPDNKIKTVSPSEYNNKTPTYNFLNKPNYEGYFQMGGTMSVPGVNGQVISSGPQPLTSVKKTRGPISKDTKGNVKTMSNRQVKKILKNTK